MDSTFRWVYSAAILAVGGLVGCSGGSPVAPTDPGVLVLSVKVRSEGVIQEPVDGEYRLPAAKTGSVHLLATFPNVDLKVMRIRVEDCLLPEWSGVYHGGGFHPNRFQPTLLKGQTRELWSVSWSSRDLAGAFREPTALWPKPEVCVFVGKVTVEAPEYSAPVEVTATAILHFY